MAPNHQKPDRPNALRDWFAGLAIPAAVELELALNEDRLPSAERVAQACYRLADAMLRERAK